MQSRPNKDHRDHRRPTINVDSTDSSMGMSGFNIDSRQKFGFNREGQSERCIVIDGANVANHGLYKDDCYESMWRDINHIESNEGSLREEEQGRNPFGRTFQKTFHYPYYPPSKHYTREDYDRAIGDIRFQSRFREMQKFATEWWNKIILVIQYYIHEGYRLIHVVNTNFYDLYGSSPIRNRDREHHWQDQYQLDDVFVEMNNRKCRIMSHFVPLQFYRGKVKFKELDDMLCHALSIIYHGVIVTNDNFGWIVKHQITQTHRETFEELLHIPGIQHQLNAKDIYSYEHFLEIGRDTLGYRNRDRAHTDTGMVYHVKHHYYTFTSGASYDSRGEFWPLLKPYPYFARRLNEDPPTCLPKLYGFQYAHIYLQPGNEHEMAKRKRIQPSEDYQIMSYFGNSPEGTPERYVQHLIECENKPLFLLIQQQLTNGRYINKRFYCRRERRERWKELEGNYRCSSTQKTVERLVDETLIPKYFMPGDMMWYTFLDKHNQMVYPCRIVKEHMMSAIFLQKYRGERRRELPMRDIINTHAHDRSMHAPIHDRGTRITPWL